MEVTTDRKDATLIAAVDGRIDSATAREFEEVLSAAIAKDDKAVIVDLGALSYISSAGLRAILLIAKGLWKRDAQFAVCALSESVDETFKLAGFDKIIKIHPSQPEALEAVSG